MKFPNGYSSWGMREGCEDTLLKRSGCRAPHSWRHFITLSPFTKDTLLACWTFWLNLRILLDLVSSLDNIAMAVKINYNYFNNILWCYFIGCNCSTEIWRVDNGLKLIVSGCAMVHQADPSVTPASPVIWPTARQSQVVTLSLAPR